MQIAERIRADVTTAMKAGDRDRVAALRLVLSELQKAAKDGQDDELAVLRRERKRRRESEVAFRDAGRPELADGEAYEAAAIDAYLPAELSDAELSDAELDALVTRAIAETGAEGPRDMGRAIRHVMDAAGGRAEGRRVSSKLKEALS
ncbi:MAG TPA: GatB/YqeY domain-containing protein [Solirubrobacteraceae bacterium]|nr:GatB/YqeY domain-containing protein [Solirubrobacteraceae bacterium]